MQWILVFELRDCFDAGNAIDFEERISSSYAVRLKLVLSNRCSTTLRFSFSIGSLNNCLIILMSFAIVQLLVTQIISGLISKNRLMMRSKW